MNRLHLSVFGESGDPASNAALFPLRYQCDDGDGR